VDFGLFHTLHPLAGGGQKDRHSRSLSFDYSHQREGWRSLEFIAWWVPDQARGGTNNPTSTIRLAAGAGQTVQLADDPVPHRLFCIAKGDDLSPVLAAVQQLADGFKKARCSFIRKFCVIDQCLTRHRHAQTNPLVAAPVLFLSMTVRATFKSALADAVSVSGRVAQVDPVKARAHPVGLQPADRRPVAGIGYRLLLSSTSRTSSART